MTPREITMLLVSELGLALTLAGLILRGRARSLRSFTVYVAVVFVGEMSVFLFPSVFWTWNWWLARQIVYSSLKLAIGAELATSLFAAFPGAQRTANLATLGLLMLTFVFLATPTGEPTSLSLIRGQLLPRLGNGALGVFVGLAAVARWYVVPMRALHKAVLSGFVAYGVLIVVAGALLDVSHSPLRDLFNVLSGVGYCTLTAWWTMSVFKAKEPDPAQTPLLAALEARC